MANVYGYRIGIKYDSDDYVDRGYIFADNQLSAVNKLFNEFKGEDEDIYHFEIFDFTSNGNDVHSVYTLLSDSGVSKDELAYELKNWSLI